MSDAAAIEDMQLDSVYSLVRQHYSDLQIESIITYLGVFDPQLILDGTYYVAELAGVIVGSGGWARYAEAVRSLCRGLEGCKPPCASGADAVDIRAIFVHPDWARRGVARVLMDVVENKALEAGFRRAEVIATLTGAPLYRALGYAERGRPNLELPNGVQLPAVFLEKRLDLVV